jgi:hypothetical protein
MIKAGRYINLTKGKLDNFNYSINTFIPTPNESDYKRGYITRYFVQKANDLNSLIYEVSKDTYKEITSNPLLINTSLDWRITGDDTDIKKSNSESVRLASQKINKLQLYLPNLLQFKKKT